jgi:intergrase/recombinase
VPEFTGETPSATEAEKPTKPTLLPEVTEMAEAPTRTEFEKTKDFATKNQRDGRSAIDRRIGRNKRTNLGIKNIRSFKSFSKC